MDVIIEYMLNNHDKILYVVAAVSLLVELTMIGLSGPLLFFAIGCFITGLLVSFQIISSWEVEALFVGIFTLLAAILLWQPLKRFQGNKKVTDQSSDLIGQKVITSQVVTNVSGNVRYSGIDWTARLDDAAPVLEIPANTRVLITGVDGNIIIVSNIED